MSGTASMLRLCDESVRLSSLLGVLLRMILPEFLGSLLLGLRHLVLRLVAPWATPQHVLELRLLFLQLLEVLLHLLLVLQGLEGRHLVRVWQLALVGLLRLHHHLLLWPHVVGLHLLLANHDAFVVVDAGHVHHLRLEFGRSVPAVSLLLAGVLPPGRARHVRSPLPGLNRVGALCLVSVAQVATRRQSRWPGTAAILPLHELLINCLVLIV